MPLVLLIAVFIALPLAELYVILEVVGEALGAPLTVFLLAADSVLGAILLRIQGRAVWRQFSEAIGSGQMPHREVVEGVLVVFGGAFLVTPGFITDLVGLLLLIPPTRALVRRTLMRRLARRLGIRLEGGRRAGGAPPPSPHPDVNGTAGDYGTEPRRDPRAPRLDP